MGVLLGHGREERVSTGSSLGGKDLLSLGR